MSEHISIKEFAERMKWSISTVRRAIRNKEIRAVQRRRHGSWRIALTEIAKFDRHHSNVTQ